MQLYILDKDPCKAAELIPDKYKFKMLIELAQLICSAGLSKVYKPVPQGKELQQWIKTHGTYIFRYFTTLLDWSVHNIDMKADTINNLTKIRDRLWNNNKYLSTDFNEEYPNDAYFRYASAYQYPIPSKTLLPIEVCIEAYKEYLQWKLSGVAIKGKNIEDIIIDTIPCIADIQANQAFEDYKNEH